VILVDDPAKNVTATNTRLLPQRGLGIGRRELQTSMRACLVVMADGDDRRGFLRRVDAIGVMIHEAIQPNQKWIKS
jgi:hypothetical protein